MKKKYLTYIFLVLNLHCYADSPVKIKFPRAEILNEHTARIPFKLIDHLIVIEAELLNKKGNFILDTGSETLVLNKVHFPQKYGNNKKKKPSSGIINSIDNPLEKRLEEFKLHNLLLKGENSDVIDLSHIEKIKKIKVLGIIGYSILKDYEVFIDLYLQQVTLTKVDKNGVKLNSKVYLEKIVDSISFKLKKHTIVVSAYVNETRLRLGFDTAAEFNQLNKNTNKDVLKNFVPKRKLKLNGAGGGEIEVLAGNLNRLRLSDTNYLGPMKTMLTNLSKLNETFGTNLDGVLGYEFLKYKRTIINYKKEKLYFIDYPIFKQ